MRPWTAIAFVLTGLLAGCGGTGESNSPDDSPQGIEIVATSVSDQKIASDLKKYMVRNCPTPDLEIPDRVKERYEKHGPQALERFEQQFNDLKAFCSSVSSIEVKSQRITVRTDLQPGDEAAGEAFCMIVRGSDVADPVPGHTLLDESDEPIKVCGTRNAYR